MAGPRGAALTGRSLGAVPPEERALAALELALVNSCRSVPRTKLVKLVYLVDERFYRLYGCSVTGLEYQYDHFGPNAVGGAIVRTGDRLRGAELAIAERRSAGGRTWYAYSLGVAPRFGPALSAGVSEVLQEIVCQYGRMKVEDIVAASKKTRPFRDGPSPGARLRLYSLREDAVDRLGPLRAEAAARARRYAVATDDVEGIDEPAGGIIDKMQARALAAAG